jgi:hypothetical protein
MSSVFDHEFDPCQSRKVHLRRSSIAAIVCTVRINLPQMRLHALRCNLQRSNLQFMRCRFPRSSSSFIVSALLFFSAAARCLSAEPTPQATAAFNNYIRDIESRLAQQHLSQNTFLLLGLPQAERRLRGGELIVEDLTPKSGEAFPGALLHHWRGTAFAPGAKAADFEPMMKDFNAYPRYFSPQVVEAKVLSQQDDGRQDHGYDHFGVTMRLCQHHIITVVMDATYDITFARLDSHHGYSASRSTRISEIDAPGTASERPLNSAQEHGFLWRMNTYWSYEEQDGGLYMQIESITLTRSIPAGLGWAVRPFVESVPRESLEFTLRSTCNALRR